MNVKIEAAMKMLAEQGHMAISCSHMGQDWCHLLDCHALVKPQEMEHLADGLLLRGAYRAVQQTSTRGTGFALSRRNCELSERVHAGCTFPLADFYIKVGQSHRSIRINHYSTVIMPILSNLRDFLLRIVQAWIFQRRLFTDPSLLMFSAADNPYVPSSEAVSLKKSVKSAASSEGTASKPPRVKGVVYGQRTNRTGCPSLISDT
jgi:hypothetical protein